MGIVLQTILYTYGDSSWKDKLTAYNGQAISYDVIGNPLSDGEWNYQWDQGRRLWQMYKGIDGQPGNAYVSFHYNADGLRVSKDHMYYDAAGNMQYVYTDYTLHGKNIVHMTQEGNDLHFWYDAAGRPALVEFNGTKYAYIHNLQGDIVGIVDSNGTEVVKYTYDSWGKLLSTTGSLTATLGKLNPLRYRGYVYDEETGLYYLRSRYYNPEWGRFVNADNYMGNSEILSHNLYSYCKNLPINYVDSEGNREITADNVNLKKDLNIAPGAMTKLTNREFVIYLKEMVRSKWQYDYKGDDLGMRYGFVDCVSAYRYVIKQYYDSKGYSLYLPKKDGNALDNVAELVERGVYDLQSIADDYSNLVPGMAIFCKDENGNYTHVAYYLGDGKAIESNIKTKNYPAGVHIIDMKDGNFVECAYLNGLDYLDWR